MTKTIVMVHGMYTGGRYWTRLKQYFEEKQYHCLTPTLRYHDVDPKDEPHPNLGTTSLNDYAMDIENIITNLDEKPLLIGHSMGGLITQILGERGLAKGIVLLTPAPPRGIITLEFSALKSCLASCTKWGFWKKPLKISFNAAVYAMLHLYQRMNKKQPMKSLYVILVKLGKK